MLSHAREEILRIVIGQLNSFCWEFDAGIIQEYIDIAINRMEKCLRKFTNKKIFEIGGVIPPYHTVFWSVFLYYLSNSLATCTASHHEREASLVYYLNKILHANDWFYAISLPEHFWAEHPVGSVLGRAWYGDYFFVYQGTTVGGNRKNGKIYYPTIGDNVIMYAHSTILGDSHIGNNVIISANTYLINENIPDNSIVFGSTPQIVIKRKTDKEIKEMMKHIWCFEETDEV